LDIFILFEFSLVIILIKFLRWLLH